jgi:polysaccharide export outer membrane protein
MKRLLVSSIAVLVTLVAPPSDAAAQVAQHAATKAAAAAIETVQPNDPTTNDYVIGPGDVLSLVFWREPALSGDVLVRPDGKISVPLLDDIEGAGLTPLQLRERLAAAALRFVTAPTVTVVVKQINSQKVYITGLIAHPGQYPLTGSLTILQLIATSGGLLDFAKSRDIRIRRTENGRPVALRVDYDEITRTGAGDVELKSGDTVIVR